MSGFSKKTRRDRRRRDLRHVLARDLQNDVAGLETLVASRPAE